MIVDNAIYVDGVRVEDPETLSVTRERCIVHDGMAWVGLFKPTPEELEMVALEFSLPPLAVSHVFSEHQRPKIERYGDVVFVVLRAARYIDVSETVEFGDIHVFMGSDFVITVRHAANPDLAHVRHWLEETPNLLKIGPPAVLYAIVDQVVDEFEPVADGLENDIDEIEDELFGGDVDVSRRAYELNREVIEFQRAVTPLHPVLDEIAVGFGTYEDAEALQPLVRDVEDHLIQVEERIASFRVLLQSIMSVNLSMVTVRQNAEVTALTQASIRQNDDVKKISAWAAILFAPTLVGTIYGMNFEHMPELEWKLGYPFALALMLGISVLLWLIFKRRGWIGSQEVNRAEQIVLDYEKSEANVSGTSHKSRKRRPRSV